MKRSQRWILMLYARRWLMVLLITVAVAILLVSVGMVLYLSGGIEVAKEVWNGISVKIEQTMGQKPEKLEEVGLRFELNDSGTEYTVVGVRRSTDYIVTGLGTPTSTDVVIPETYEGLPVTEIRNNAFNNCSKMTSIVIPSSVTIIGVGAFGYCYSLTQISMPEGVEEIGESAFYRCSSLQSVTIPNSVSYIGKYAFSECSLQSVTIPNSVSFIGENAFSECSDLTDIYFTGTEEEWQRILTGDAGDAPLPDTVTVHFNYTGE